MSSLFDLLNAVAALEKPGGIIAFPLTGGYVAGSFVNDPSGLQKLKRLAPQAEPTLIAAEKQAFDQLLESQLSEPQQKVFQALAQAYWPGPLKMVMDLPVLKPAWKSGQLYVTDNPVMQALIPLLRLPYIVAVPLVDREQKRIEAAAQVLAHYGGLIDQTLIEDKACAGKSLTVTAIESDGGLAILRQGDIVLD